MRFARTSSQTGRGLAAAGLALCALLLFAAGARADAAQVTVVSPGGAEQTLALAALAGQEDVTEREYAVRSAAGESRQIVTGFSLAKLIDAAGADPYSFSYLEVQRPGGGAVTLSREQAIGEDAFADGPPVAYATPTGTAFIRPATSTADLNATDSFEAPQGLTVVLRKGQALQVRAKASAKKVEVGEKVSFEAIVERSGSGEELTFSWAFDDGGSGEGQRVSHKFAKRGTYDVLVGVTAVGNEAGASAVVTVQVGEPEQGGPDRKGGGTNEAAGAPDHGSADGAGGAGSSVGSGSGFEAAPTPATAGPTPTPAPEPTPQPQPETEPEPKPKPEGDLVSGELLEAPSPAEAAVARQAAARTGNLSDGGGSGGGVPGEAWGALVTLGLLGAGALIEARGGLWRRRGGLG